MSVFLLSFGRPFAFCESRADCINSWFNLKKKTSVELVGANALKSHMFNNGKALHQIWINNAADLLF